MKNTWLVFLVCFCCSPGVRPSMAADEAICPENFPKEIRKVTDNVHVAIGYAIANCIMVIAPEGLIIVDVTETVNASKEIFDDFRNISSKPIKAIIYTHYHHDHIMGAKTFVEDPTNPPEIWADIKLLETIEKFQTHAFAIRYVRATRQFGNFVNDTNGGLGNKLDQGEEGFVFPNKFVDNHTVEATIAGLNVTFMQIPGESSDQIGMWVPAWKMFFCGDTFYFAFPNLYSIRGTPMRDPKLWYTSVQNIADLSPDYLVLSHHYPVEGKEKIQEYLIKYRDAIQYVHDQSVRYINKGFYPDQVVELVKLPSMLANESYLQQCYGTVPWSSKGVFQLYLGWFSGDPIDLFPMTYTEKAKRMQNLTGGINGLVRNARKALRSGDNQWALELSSYALELNPDNFRARNLKRKALYALGEATSLTLANNYYKTFSLEVSGNLELKFPPEYIHNFIYSFRMRQLFEIMPAMFIAENCSYRTDIVRFKFQDTGLEVYLQLRNGVAIISDSQPKSDAFYEIVYANENLYREFVFSMSVGAGWPYDGGLPFGIELTPPFTMSSFKDIMYCFDWYLNAKID